MEFRDKVKTAMMYPAFIFVVFIGVLLGMLYGIVPKIGGVFKSLRLPLPLPTQVLIAMSDFLIAYTLQTFAGVLIVGFWPLLFLHEKKEILCCVIYSNYRSFALSCATST